MSKHPLANCADCVFKDAPFVPTQNPHPRAKLAVVGEAPGAYEAGRGIPFTGPSGRLLDQVLAHHGYDRSEVMVTNVCLCRPADNADPPKSAVACCKPRLDAELAASGVERILAVGGTAASNLIDPKKKISTLRIGPPKPYIENPQVQVVASWHPAYCLRAPDAFPSLVSDVGKLRKGSITSTWTYPTVKVFDAEDNALAAIERLWAVPGPLVIDIETGFDKDEVFEHPDHYELLCIGISYGPRKVAVLGTNALRIPSVISALGRLLRDKKVVGHNIKSDIAGLYPLFGQIVAEGDTMLQSYAQDERPGHHSLEKLGIEKLGTPNWKEDFRRYLPGASKNYALAPRARLYQYNGIDVDVTRELYDTANQTMNEREHKIHNFLVKAANAVVNLERAGITFDLEYSRELQVTLEKELYELELEISEIAGRALNPRSVPQLQRWFSENGMSLPSTNKETLEFVLEKNISEQVRQFITQLLLHRRRAKLNGTYVKGYHKRIYKGKVYTTYTLHGTTSGRLASKNPNLQNVVRDKRIKHQFTVEDDRNILIQADYKQAEGRVITTLAKDDYLAGLFRDPTKDIFNDMCDQIYGAGKYGKEERVKIKSVFYGLAYGRGAASIGIELGITHDEAKDLLFNFKALIPATVQWQASVAHHVLSGEDLLTPFGRKRSFWLITEQNKSEVLNEALSFLPQSIASDICLTSLIELQPKLKGLATTRLTVHDAMIFECREADADEVIDIATKEMVNAGLAFTDYVPFAVDVSRGKHWSEL